MVRTRLRLILTLTLYLATIYIAIVNPSFKAESPAFTELTLCVGCGISGKSCGKA
jgi:hypothetical protein